MQHEVPPFLFVEAEYAAQADMLDIRQSAFMSAVRLLGMLGTLEIFDDVETAAIMLDGQDLIETKTQVEMEAFGSEELRIGQDRYVWLDQLPWIEDGTGNVAQTAVDGVFRLAVQDDAGRLQTAQYMFKFADTTDDKDTIYYGYELSDETELTDLEHLFALDMFLREVEKTVVAEQIQAFKNHPSIIKIEV